MPQPAFDSLIKPTPRHVYGEATEEIARLSSIVATLRKAHAKTLPDEPYEVDDAIVELLERTPDLLPLIHFIYMRKNCTFDEVRAILEKNGATTPLGEALNALEGHKLAVVDRDAQCLRRHKHVFRVPQTPRGVTFKDAFIVDEVRKSLNRKERGGILARDNTFVWSGINCFNMNKEQSKVEDRITDLTATLAAEETDLEEDGAVPFFVTVIVSSRECYDSRNGKDTRNRQTRRNRT